MSDRQAGQITLEDMERIMADVASDRASCDALLVHLTHIHSAMKEEGSVLSLGKVERPLVRRGGWREMRPTHEVMAAIDRASIRHFSCQACKAAKGEHCYVIGTSRTAKTHAVRWNTAERRLRPRTHPGMLLRRPL